MVVWGAAGGQRWVVCGSLTVLLTHLSVQAAVEAHQRGNLQAQGHDSGTRSTVFNSVKHVSLACMISSLSQETIARELTLIAPVPEAEEVCTGALTLAVGLWGPCCTMLPLQS